MRLPLFNDAVKKLDAHGTAEKETLFAAILSKQWYNLDENYIELRNGMMLLLHKWAIEMSSPQKDFEGWGG